MRNICRPPNNFVTCDRWGRVELPRQCAVVRQYGGVDGHTFRCARGLGKRPDGCPVDFGYPGVELEIAELYQVAELLAGVIDADILVLMREVLARFCEASRGEAGIKEGLMVSASEEPICAVDDADCGEERQSSQD